MKIRDFSKRRRELPEHEVIHFMTRHGGVCHCRVVCCAIGDKLHVAFLNIAGSPQHPTGDIEGLASAALRVMGAPAASLVFWDVDRHEWEDRVTYHRVEFGGLSRGGFASPRWRMEPLPELLAEAVARAWATGATVKPGSSAGRSE